MLVAVSSINSASPKLDFSPIGHAITRFVQPCQLRVPVILSDPITGLLTDVFLTVQWKLRKFLLRRVDLKNA